MVGAVVVGAGLSGLTCALELERQGVDTLVVERGGEVGGTMRTLANRGFQLDLGAHSFANNRPVTQALIERVGLTPERVDASPAAANRYLYVRGELLRVPRNPVGFVSWPGLSRAARARLLLEPFYLSNASEPGETLASLLDRRIGQEARTVLADAVIGGIYASSTEDLGAFDAFPALAQAEAAYGSMLLGMIASGKGPQRGSISSFRSGMGALPRAIAAALPARALALSTECRSVRRSGEGFAVALSTGGAETTVECRAFVCAAPAPIQAALLSNTLSEGALEALRAVRYAPVAVCGVGAHRSSFAKPFPPAFGFLVPRRQGLRALGCVFDSALFPGRAPEDHVLLSVFVGGSRQPEDVDLSDADLQALAMGELHTALGLNAEPRFFHAARWTRGIPVYAPGHRDRVARALNEAQAAGNLELLGNWQGGVSLHDCIDSATSAAARLARHLGRIP
jgi:oxygen-dependent protoporphyrinogen oxidase